MPFIARTPFPTQEMSGTGIIPRNAVWYPLFLYVEGENKMEQKIDVVCLVSVKKTGRIHPATFTLMPTKGNPIPGTDVRSARLIDFHPEGFLELQSALQWLADCKVRATYIGPAFNTAAVTDMNGPYSFKQDELKEYASTAAVAA
jgi:hypothetical protein